jgi:hypothetical protein
MTGRDPASPAERGAPVKGELEQMIRRLAPEIARLFRQAGSSEAEARRVLGEVLADFARRWARIINRERWLLRAVEKALHGPRA